MPGLSSVGHFVVLPVHVVRVVSVPYHQNFRLIAVPVPQQLRRHLSHSSDPVVTFFDGVRGNVCVNATMFLEQKQAPQIRNKLFGDVQSRVRNSVLNFLQSLRAEVLFDVLLCHDVELESAVFCTFSQVFETELDNDRTIFVGISVPDGPQVFGKRVPEGVFTIILFMEADFFERRPHKEILTFLFLI